STGPGRLETSYPHRDNRDAMALLLLSRAAGGNGRGHKRSPSSGYSSASEGLLHQTRDNREPDIVRLLQRKPRHHHGVRRQTGQPRSPRDQAEEPPLSALSYSSCLPSAPASTAGARFSAFLCQKLDHTVISKCARRVKGGAPIGVRGV